MLSFLLFCLSFLVLFIPLPLLPLHCYVCSTVEMKPLLLLFWQGILSVCSQCLKTSSGFPFLWKISTQKKNLSKSVSMQKPAEWLPILDLPELVLEDVLGRLSPVGLCNMAEVCCSLRDRCRSDHLWERHLQEKWGRVLGQGAFKEWQKCVSDTKNSGVLGEGRSKGWKRILSCVWPSCWLKLKIHGRIKPSSTVDSTMWWYLSLEGGKFWFPAQVYNRENGHVGFMLSCYDAQLIYDRTTDTFHARYPPHGRRTTVIEEGIQWDRLRAAPVDTSAHDLHISDCLNDLRPGDHVEIQWRRNKEFPYGWWYGVVGHLDSCDGISRHCRCHVNDTMVLEFNQYAPGSRWHRTSINRKDHREEGNETDGFYGGIRKLQTEEISTWKRLWPTETLD